MTTLAAAPSRAFAAAANSRYLRYGGASVVAVAADFALFLALVALGLDAPVAASAAYVLGGVVHWVVSSRAVFTQGTARRGTVARRRQKLLFALTALVGLALTIAVVDAASDLGLPAAAAKLGAVAASFQATWFLRRVIVFTEA